jgi:hypothetical protein
MVLARANLRVPKFQNVNTFKGGGGELIIEDIGEYPVMKFLDKNNILLKDIIDRSKSKEITVDYKKKKSLKFKFNDNIKYIITKNGVMFFKTNDKNNNNMINILNLTVKEGELKIDDIDVNYVYTEYDNSDYKDYYKDYRLIEYLPQWRQNKLRELKDLKDIFINGRILKKKNGDLDIVNFPNFPNNDFFPNMYTSAKKSGELINLNQINGYFTKSSEYEPKGGKDNNINTVRVILNRKREINENNQMNI